METMTAKNTAAKHKRLPAWVEEAAELCKPEQVRWCDGSHEEYQAMLRLMIMTGSAIPLAENKRPNSVLVRRARPMWPGSKTALSSALALKRKLADDAADRDDGFLLAALAGDPPVRRPSRMSVLAALITAWPSAPRRYQLPFQARPFQELSGLHHAGGQLGPGSSVPGGGELGRVGAHSGDQHPGIDRADPGDLVQPVRQPQHQDAQVRAVRGMAAAGQPVATATEIYDYLRLLYARVGRTYCLNCGQEVKKDTVDEVAERILALGEGTRVQAFFPVQPPPKPAEPEKSKGRRIAKKKAPKPADDSLLKERLFELRKRGYNRLYQNGRVVEFSTPESLLDLNFAEPVLVLIDRIAVSPEARARIVDAVEQGYREAGEVLFETAPPEGEAAQRLRFSQRFECKAVQHSLRRAGAAAVLVQQSIWRLPALPGLRQHHRFRSEPGDPQQDAYSGRRRDRALDQAEISAAGDGDAPLCARRGHSARRTVAGPHQPSSKTTSSTVTANSGACAASSSTWSARSTSCTCGSSSAGIAATRCAPTARACACGAKRGR